MDKRTELEHINKLEEWKLCETKKFDKWKHEFEIESNKKITQFQVINSIGNCFLKSMILISGSSLIAYLAFISNMINNKIFSFTCNIKLSFWFLVISIIASVMAIGFVWITLTIEKELPKNKKILFSTFVITIILAVLSIAFFIVACVEFYVFLNLTFLNQLGG